MCGYLHELPGQTFDVVRQGRVVRPRCLLHDFPAQGQRHAQAVVWGTVREAWLQQHPKAAECDRNRAVFIGRSSDLSVDALLQTLDETEPTVSVFEAITI